LSRTPFLNPPPSQGDPLDRCERGELGGGLGEGGGIATEFYHPFKQPQRVVHITLRETLAAIHSLTFVTRQCPSPVKFLLKSDSTVTKSVVSKRSIKAKLNEPVQQVLAQLARGALRCSRVCAERDQQSGQTVEDTVDTKRLDHQGGCPGVGVALGGPQAQHRCFRGRQS